MNADETPVPRGGTCIGSYVVDVRSIRNDMPLAAVVPISARKRGEYVLLQLALPGEPVHDIGVLLLDADEDSTRHALRLRAHWEDLAGAGRHRVSGGAASSDFEDKIGEMGARRLLESWEDSLSHVLRVSEREAVPVDSFSRVADRIFERHVEKIAVERFRTHLPLYTPARGGRQIRRR